MTEPPSEGTFRHEGAARLRSKLLMAITLFLHFLCIELLADVVPTVQFLHVTTDTRHTSVYTEGM
jgi:hypothetical protein